MSRSRCSYLPRRDVRVRARDGHGAARLTASGSDSLERLPGVRSRDRKTQALPFLCKLQWAACACVALTYALSRLPSQPAHRHHFAGGRGALCSGRRHRLCDRNRQPGRDPALQLQSLYFPRCSCPGINVLRGCSTLIERLGARTWSRIRKRTRLCVRAYACTHVCL